MSCFCVNNELVPWFHGLLGRTDADRVLAATAPRSPTSKTSSDGTFLIRFSESHPTKFTLSYVKIHASGPFVGKRELKNCLIENLGRAGYALSDSKTRAYASILSFVQRSAARLKHGVRLASCSAIAVRCASSHTVVYRLNTVVGAVRGRKALQRRARADPRASGPAEQRVHGVQRRDVRPLADVVTVVGVVVCAARRSEERSVAALCAVAANDAAREWPSCCIKRSRLLR